MTIVRGVAVPELLTREAYGALNGALLAPGVVTGALGRGGGSLSVVGDRFV